MSTGPAVGCRPSGSPPQALPVSVATWTVSPERYCHSMGDAGSQGDAPLPETVRDLPVDEKNTAPETVARYDYQYECVALTVLQRIPSDDLLGVVLERSTDVVFIPRNGQPELASIKHREPSQNGAGGWNLNELKNRGVFSDLYDKWVKSDRGCTVSFLSNAGFVQTGYKLYRACVKRDPSAHRSVVRYLVDQAGLSRDDASAFLTSFNVASSPLPARDLITDIATAQVRKFLRSHGRSDNAAEHCYRSLLERIREASTDTPDARRTTPIKPAATLAQFFRDSDVSELQQRYLSADDIRNLILAEHDRIAATEHSPHYTKLEPDPLFTGRNEELRSIEDALNIGTPHPVAPVALHGVTGSGKTSVALHFASRHWSTVRIHVIDGSSRANIIKALDQLDTPAGVSVGQSFGGGLERMKTPVTPALPGNSFTLLIIDGVESADAVRGVIPRQSLCRVLITTTVAHLDDGYTHLAVDGWARQDTLKYIHRVLPEADDDAATRLAETLHDHPLAITQAVNFCRTLAIDIDAYLDRFEREPVTTLQRGEAAGHESTAATAILMNIRALAQRDSDALALLCCLSFIAHDPLPEEAFDAPGGPAHVVDAALPEPPKWWQRLLSRKQATDRDESGYSFAVNPPLQVAASIRERLRDSATRDQAVLDLRDFSLIARQGRGLIVHPLVKLVIQESVDSARPWLEVMFGLFEENLSPADASANDKLDSYIIHIAALAEHALNSQLHGPTVLASCAYLARRLVEYDTNTQAVEFAKRASLIADQQRIHRKIPDRFSFEISLAAAMALGLSGHTDESLRLLWKTANEAREAGNEHARLDTLRHLGSIAETTGDRNLAETVLSELPSDLLDTASPTQFDLYLARTKTPLLRLVGEFESAQAHSRWLLDHLGHFHDAHHQLIEGAYADAALLACDEGDATSRLNNSRAMLEAHRRHRAEGASPSPDDFSFVRQIVFTADPTIDKAVEERGRANIVECKKLLSEAEALLDEARELCESRFGTENPAYGHILGVRGRLQFIRTSYAEAFRDLKAAEEILRNSPDVYRNPLTFTLYHLAQVYLIQGNEQAAIELGEEVLRLDLATYGSDHVEVERDRFLLEQMHDVCRKHKRFGVAHAQFFPQRLDAI